MSNKKAESLVLAVLEHDPHTGRFIRSRLKEMRVEMDVVPFYRMMSDLEKSGDVRSWSEEEEIGNEVVKLKWYERMAREARGG